MITLARLIRYLKPQWRLCLVGLLCTACFSLLSAFSITLILPIVDQVLVRSVADTTAQAPLSIQDGIDSAWQETQSAFRTEGYSKALEAGRAGVTRILDRAAPLSILAWLCAITLLAALFKTSFDAARRLIFVRVEQRSAEAVRVDLFKRLLGFPLSTHKMHPSGQLLSRIVTDVELIKRFTINNAVTFLNQIALLGAFLWLCIWTSPQLSVVTFLIVPPIVFAAVRLSSKLRRRSRKTQEFIGELTENVSETLSNIRVVKGFVAESRESERFSRSSRRYATSIIRLMSLSQLATPASELWGMIIGTAVLFYGGRLVLDPAHPLTPGSFLTFLVGLVSMLHPLKVLANTVTSAQRGLAAADRVFQAMDMEQEQDSPLALPPKPLRQGISFVNVSFRYEPHQVVLENVSIQTPAGTTTALVGPSGGGKSTLADLIPRFYDPESGVVTWDGTDIKMLSLKALRGKIGIVTQETLLFNDTVFNNLAYGAKDASLERVRAAAQHANAHDFIEAMAQGYETFIGERGIRLSGGQRQRLAIARAILRDPEVLILDEATSSLDSASELLVQQAFSRLRTNRTTFVIAHRLSTILDADRIVVIDKGRVVDSGTHETLMTRCSLYQRLHEIQFKTESV